MPTRHISKILSANDTGDTGGHQAGILVPKDPEILAFFPKLDAAKYNPRCLLHFMDENGHIWDFAFIYYNNRLFGGTRNEYRLTRMTKYLRQASLVPGDEVTLSRDKGDRYLVAYRRKAKLERTATGALKLGSAWRIVRF